MHNIEPYYHWINLYSSTEDRLSPFYGREYSEFTFTNSIYNYYIHPQWDEFGSNTLYVKVLYADYDEQYAILELIGEWNDAIQNDVMYLKRQLIDAMTKEGIVKFIILCENVLNFHGSDDCYYEEWKDDIADEFGWIVFMNTLEHVYREMENYQLHFYVNFGEKFNGIHWRKMSPQTLLQVTESLLHSQTKAVYY